MKSERKYKARRLSKGERLHWSSLKKTNTVEVNEEMLQGRRVSEKEINARQRLFTDKLSLLVP